MTSARSSSTGLVVGDQDPARAPLIFLDSVLRGIAQVFFQGNAITGVLFAVGLIISSRAACGTALAGSLTGPLIAWGMGAAEPAIRSGAFGFNSVLIAIAMGSVYFVRDRVSTTYALLATTASAVVFAAVSAALEPLGLPALTFPFVLITWLFLLASPAFPKLRLVANVNDPASREHENVPSL